MTYFEKQIDYSRRENKTKPLPSWQIRCIMGRDITSVSPPRTSSEPGKWLRCLHGASTVQAIRRTEYRPAIDKPNSLVPHSLPSKLPLDMSGSHRTQWKPRSIHFLSSRSWHAMKFYFEGVNCLRRDEVTESVPLRYPIIEAFKFTVSLMKELTALQCWVQS